MAVLLDAVADFPFEENVHRAVWLSSILTMLSRYAFEGNAPLFLFSANQAGTGKGLLANVTSTIATGERFATAQFTRDAVELDN